MEHWKDIPGYEGLYQISDMGNVKKIYKTSPGYIKKPSTDKDGYQRVMLSKNNTTKNYFVHRLVAIAFVENPCGHPVVNHKDENKSNNCADNLEWCTVKYNTRYNNSHVKRVKKLKKPILQMTLDGKVVARWDSRSDIERSLGYNGSVISACCLGYPSAKTAYGYRWEFVG